MTVKYSGGAGNGYIGSSLYFTLDAEVNSNQVCEGDSVRFLATVKGLEGDYGYQWFRLGSGGDVLLSDSSSFVYPQVSLPDSGFYYCLVTNRGGDLARYSDTLSLSVGRFPGGALTRPSGRDTVICLGDTLQLAGSSPVSGATFYWSGEKILTSPVQDRVLVAPDRDGEYVLQSRSGICSSWDTVRVVLNRAFVDLPSVVNAVEGETVVLTALDALGDALPGGRLHWWRDGVTDLGVGNPLSVSAGDRNMEIRVDYDSGVCTVSDATQVRVKSQAAFSGGRDDGYAGSSLYFTLDVEVNSNQVCEGDSVRFLATVKGLEGDYGYQWFRLGPGGDVFLSDSSSFVYPEISLPDSGFYYCLVTNRGGDLVRYSDTLSLSVGRFPGGVLTRPSGRDTVICLGDTLQLAGSSPVSGATFYWSGEKILTSPVQDRILVAPDRDGEYVLQSRSGICSSWDTVRVVLNRAFVDLPSVVNAVEGETVVLTALDALGDALPGGRLHWWRDGVTDLGVGNPLSVSAGDRNMEIRVDYDSGVCTVSDATQVRVKSQAAFSGGRDDGYAGSSLYFTLDVEVNSNQVCEGDSVRFLATVKGLEGDYGYQWFRLGPGGDVFLSDSSSFVYPQVSLPDSGFYYCLVTNRGGDLARYSDTLSLSVGRFPGGVLIRPSGRDTVICLGDTLQLAGSIPVSGATFYWSGEKILTSPVQDRVLVAPNRDGEYVLQSRSGICSSWDTVRVVLNRAFVDLPSVVNAVEGETVVLTALDALGDALPGGRLHWWRDGVTDLGVGNPLSVSAGDRDMEIRVDYDSGVCTVSDATQVRVKSQAAFSGGRDDGYAGSKLSFEAVAGITPDTVCSGDAVSFRATVSGISQYAYAWYHILPSKDTLVNDTCCFELANVSLADSGLYYCIVKDIATNDSVVSDTVLLHVIPSVNLQIVVPSGRDTTVCSGAYLSLEVETAEAVDSLLWNILKKDGTVEVQTLPGSDNLDFFGITVAYDSCVVWCGVRDRCGVSDTVLVRVIPSGVASLKPLADNRFGQCDSIDLRTLLVPRLNGVVCHSGTFSVDSVSLVGDWWSRDSLRVGCHSVRYHYSQTLGSCVNVPLVELCIDTLPSAVIVLPDHVCPGGRADSLQVVLRGSAPLSFRLEQHRFKSDGTLQKLTILPHTVSTGNVYKEIVTWLDSNAYIVYQVSGLKDRYGCMSDSVLLDTIVKRPKPMFDLFSRYPNRSDVSWNVRPGWQPYVIPHGDSVGVKAVLRTGTPAWDLLINDQRDAGYVRTVRDIPGLDTSFVLQDARTYQFRVSRDSFCTNYLDSKYVSVAFRDTGYIRMRVILEGAYHADSSRMVTGRDYRLPVYGTALPRVSGRRIIDWLEVELRSGSTVDSLARLEGCSRVLTLDTCLVLSDGTVVDRLGNETIGLRDGYLTSDSSHFYHIVLRHRNHLSVITRNACFVSNRKDSTVLVDFTSDTTVYWSGRSGSLSYHMSEVSRDKWALSAGEVNANGLVSLYDPNSTAKGLNGTPGYHPYDVNFDGIVDWPGWNVRGLRQDWYLVKMNKDKYTECRFAPAGRRPLNGCQ